MDLSRIRRATTVLALAVATGLPGAEAPAQEITLVAAGDIEWSRIVRRPELFMQPQRPEVGGWRRVPYLNGPEQRVYLESEGRALETAQSHHVRAIQYGLEFDSVEEMSRYPFRSMVPLLREADIAFANLETPLSDRAGQIGAFRTPTAFADGLRWAGLDVVSTANNHALDAGEEGLLDTREALWRAGLGAIGTGADLEDARRPFIIERNGIRVGFLGYAIAVNMGTWGFAQPGRAGVAPLDPFLIEEDIRRLRDQVDHVVLSFHWAIENSQETHPVALAFARRMIDAGADVILGHHPHVPRGVEVYRGRVILYSLGNFVFGHNHTYWMDNYVARLTLGTESVVSVEILPVAGTGNHLSQPYLLDGGDAERVLEDIAALSEKLGTTLRIEEAVGWVEIR